MTEFILLDPPPELPPDPGHRTVAIGRLRLPTYGKDVTESLGDGVEVVGAVVIGGDRRARRLAVTFPIRGDRRDDDPYAAGARARRQVRALLENAAARLPALYLQLDPDPDLNGWLACGGGELAYNGAGVTIEEFKLELEDPHIVARRDAHRQGLRLARADRRLLSVPRDLRGTLYSAAFAAETALALHALPPGATQPIGLKLLAPTTRPSLDGPVPLLVDRPDSELVSFELDEAAMGAGDVVLHDRRGIEPAFTAAGNADPQTVYGWEEIYGPRQPLTAGDVPVLANGLTRIRWIPTRAAFAVDTYDPAAAELYVEQGRVTLWEHTPAGGLLQYAALERAAVVEWTPERAIVRATLTIAGGRADVYLTLQRGWPGPRIELYTARADATVPGASVRWTPSSTGHITVYHEGPVAYESSAGSWDAAEIIDTWAPVIGAGLEPWLAMTRADAGRAMHFAVLQDLQANGRDDTAAYSGAARHALSLDSLSPGAYCSATIGAGAGAALELERRTAPNADYLGARDLAQANLTDARQALALIPR